jgi:hypothetical protein
MSCCQEVHAPLGEVGVCADLPAEREQPSPTMLHVPGLVRVPALNGGRLGHTHLMAEMHVRLYISQISRLSRKV